MGALLILTAVEVMLAYRQVFQPLRMLKFDGLVRHQVRADHWLFHALEI